MAKIRFIGAKIARDVFELVQRHVSTPLPKKGKKLQINLQLTVTETDNPGEYMIELVNLPLSNLLKAAEKHGATKVLRELEEGQDKARKKNGPFSDFFSNPFFKRGDDWF